MKVWIDAASSRTEIRVFGLTLIERHLKALSRLRPRATEICIDLGDRSMRPTLPGALRRESPIVWVATSGNVAERLLRYAQQTDSDVVLAIDGCTIVDSRLIPFLRDTPGSRVARVECDGAPAAVVRLDCKDLGRLPRQGNSLVEIGEALVASGLASYLKPEDFPAFISALRRSLPFYVLAIPDDAARARCERFLFLSNYKGSTDFFTKYVYPPLVWRLVRPLASARVHPNFVTLASILLTFGAIPLFATGHFILGLLMAYGMSVLDSVDGKLARVTFTDSKVGQILDHGLDQVHPPMWYLAWAWALGGYDPGSPVFQAGIWMTVLYVLDRLTLAIYRRVFHRALHTHAPIDGFLRTFISRRNINLPLFTVGYLLGHAIGAFYLILAWQAATLAYHAGRTFWIFVIQKARRTPSTAGQASR